MVKPLGTKALANRTNSNVPQHPNRKAATAANNTTKRPNDSKENSAVKAKKSKKDQENQENVPIPNAKSDKEAKFDIKLDTKLEVVDATRTIETKVRSFSLREERAEVAPLPRTRAETANVAVTVVTEEQPVKTEIDFSNPHSYYQAPPGLPDGVEDFDKSQVKDLNSEPHYAHDIFEYYRELEVVHRVKKYLDIQPEISKAMRAVLIDWMVEIQESFELNHETLYLAVKLVDHYLMVRKVAKNKLQLLGATCVFIAAKFDERIPPAIEDFLYICDDAYQRRDVIMMEICVLQRLRFFIGFPISYRFLRRYARCAKLSMETLTLARFILEMSLMEYDFIDIRDSEMAAAALLLALKMKNLAWSPTLEFYTGFEEQKLISLMYSLNAMISLPPKQSIKTVRTKYSHSIFFSVAKITPLPARSIGLRTEL